jgi:hypothetical protein
MAIAEEDRLIVDLVVGGMTRDEVQETVSQQLDAQRVDAVARFFRLMDLTPAMEPPVDLVAATLARIEARRNGAE